MTLNFIYTFYAFGSGSTDPNEIGSGSTWKKINKNYITYSNNAVYRTDNRPKTLATCSLLKIHINANTLCFQSISQWRVIFFYIYKLALIKTLHTKINTEYVSVLGTFFCLYFSLFVNYFLWTVCPCCTLNIQDFLIKSASSVSVSFSSLKIKQFLDKNVFDHLYLL